MVILVEIGSWYFRLPSLQFVDESLWIGNHFVNQLLLGMKNINLQQKLFCTLLKAFGYGDNVFQKGIKTAYHLKEILSLCLLRFAVLFPKTNLVFEKHGLEGQITTIRLK